MENTGLYWERQSNIDNFIKDNNVQDALKYIEVNIKQNRGCRLTLKDSAFNLGYVQMRIIQNELNKKGIYSRRFNSFVGTTLHIGWCTGISDMMNRFMAKHVDN